MIVVLLGLIFLVLLLGRKGFHNLVGFLCFLALLAIWFGPDDAKTPPQKPHAAHHYHHSN